MKFALRDDDLNYFFNPTEIQDWYKDIWDICPVSMSVVPFIKGDWKKYILDAEKNGPGIMSQKWLEELKNDCQVYPIDQNRSLVDFLVKCIAENKIYLTIHGIHHRNEDKLIPQFKNNYGFGAEFYTTRDLSSELKKSIKYLEEIFNQKIEVFTPPQNEINYKGLKSLEQNKLNICADLPAIKNINTFKIFKFFTILKYGYFKMMHYHSEFPYVLEGYKIKLVNHHRLQPGTDINKLYNKLDETYKRNGVFILSTHSYGFNHKMNNGSKTMLEELKDLINYIKIKDGVEFVNLKHIFD